MKGLRFLLVVVLAVLVSESAVSSAEPAKIPLKLLYLSRLNDQDRTAAFSQYLSTRFASCVTVPRTEFVGRHLEGIDVVLLDWPQQSRSVDPSALGPLEDWSAPLVLLGSAGLLQAKQWSVIGNAG